MIQMIMANLQHRCRVASPHAGRAHHPNLGPVHPGFQRIQQRLGPGHLARERITNPDGQLWRRCLGFLQGVEMGVKAGDLKDFHLRQVHFLGQCPHMVGGQMPICILNEVQKLDQKIAPARPLAQQCPDFGQRAIIVLSPLGMVPPFAFAAFPDA